MNLSKNLPRILICVCIASVLSSCASEPKTPKAPPLPVEFSAAGFSLNQTRPYLDFLHNRIETFRADINIRFADIDESSVASNAILAYKSPHRFYIRGYSKYIPKVFLLVVRGDRFWLYIPKNNVVVTGSKEKLMRPKNIDLEINGFDILAAVIPQPLANSDSNEKVRKDNLYVINDYKKEAQLTWLTRTLWIDVSTLDITREEHFTPEHIRYLSIERSEFYEMHGWRIPKYITIERPLEQKSVVITLLDTQINVPIEEDLFNFTPPDGAEIDEL